MFKNVIIAILASILFVLGICWISAKHNPFDETTNSKQYQPHRGSYSQKYHPYHRYPIKSKR
jgi:hypothetical protein